MATNSRIIDDFMNEITSKNPHEIEFLQAVREVAHTVLPFIKENPKYQGYNLFERICEPERVVIFRVPWIDDHGQMNINRGFRVQMNSAIARTKGG